MLFFFSKYLSIFLHLLRSHFRHEKSEFTSCAKWYNTARRSVALPQISHALAVHLEFSTKLHQFFPRISSNFSHNFTKFLSKFHGFFFQNFIKFFSQLHQISLKISRFLFKISQTFSQSFTPNFPKTFS